jgi:colicin import membrane protein
LYFSHTYKEDIMASLIKALLRLKPVEGFGAGVSQKARKRRRNSSLRRDKAIAKARRAEAKATKRAALAARQAAKAKAKAAWQGVLEGILATAKAQADAVAAAKAAASAKAKADAEARRARAKSTLVTKAARLAHTEALVENLRTGVKALATARRRAATLVKRSKDFFRDVVVARPVRSGVVAGTVGK